MTGYQLASAVLAVVFFVTVVLLIRRDAIQVSSAFRWFVIAILALIFGLKPTWIDALASWLGISYGPILPLLLACLFLMLKALVADMERARTRVKLDRLNQKVAMLEESLNRLYRNSDQ